jgi:hypothetical protein
VLGVIVALVGAFWLADNLGFRIHFFDLDNWWALFIFIGAISPLSQAWSHYQSEGWSMRVARHLMGGAAIVTLGLLLFCGLHLHRWWPVFMIIGGLYIMTSEKRD